MFLLCNFAVEIGDRECDIENEWNLRDIIRMGFSKKQKVCWRWYTLRIAPSLDRDHDSALSNFIAYRQQP